MIEHATPVDIDAQVELLLDRLDGTETDAELVAKLCTQAPLVREIATACEQTTLFRSATASYAEFKAGLEKDSSPEDRLLAAWLHFLERMIDAPTRFHIVAAVRLCLPLVALYLPAEPVPTPEA